jgi:hypothetical protein
MRTYPALRRPAIYSRQARPFFNGACYWPRPVMAGPAIRRNAAGQVIEIDAPRESPRAVRARKARQDAGTWAKVPTRGLTYQQTAYRNARVNPYIPTFDLTEK